MTLCIHTQDRFNKACLGQLLQDAGHGASVMVMTKTGNIMLRVGIELTSLAFRVSVLTITPTSLLVTR